MHGAFERGSLTRLIFTAPQCLQPQYLFSRFLPQPMHIRRMFQVTLSYKLVDPWLVFHRHGIIFNHCTKRNNQAFKWSSKSPLCGVFPSAKRSWTFRTQIAFITKNQPTMFHPSLIATSLPLFCALLFRQSHSSRIDGVWKYDDSMISLHWISQIPMNCQCE